MDCEEGMGQPTPIFLPGKSHRRRSLVGYSPWSHKELDTTEWPSTCAGEFCSAEDEVTLAPWPWTVSLGIWHEPCDHLYLAAWVAHLHALLQQGHRQRAVLKSGVHPSLHTALPSVLSYLHMGNAGVWAIQEEESSCLWKWQMSLHVFPIPIPPPTSL